MNLGWLSNENTNINTKLKIMKKEVKKNLKDLLQSAKDSVGYKTKKDKLMTTENWGENKSFKEIGQFLNDKIEQHGYDRFYPTFLEPLRSQNFNMLEVGYGDGASLKLWKEYFPKAHITVMDIDVEGEDERSKIIKLDQSNSDHLQRMVDNVSKCKFIIDDGSHHPYHQYITFVKFFNEILEDGGIYIIEDIECNWWKHDSDIYGYEIGHFNFIDLLKQYPDKINKEFSGINNPLNVSSITFGHNCVIIIKATKEEIEFKNRPYKWKNKI
jgi:hypothetical protein